MSSQNYEKLEQDSVASEETEGFLTHNSQQRKPSWMSRYLGLSFNVATVVLIILSISCNAFLLAEVVSLREQHDVRELHPKTDYSKPENAKCQKSSR